jgi:hypothetical protein
MRGYSTKDAMCAYTDMSLHDRTPMIDIDRNYASYWH